MDDEAASVATSDAVTDALQAKFDFSDMSEWPKWMRRFERYRIASGLRLEYTTQLFKI